ncbi:MAG: hypothetical protein KKD26_02985 [Alphaproteobacteria bacterium]|jgi:UDP-N-acetylmuramyl pentapeptide phosphotransferase/UDP-N-acetylglucosamine-1-phosphate transferase|uniref:Uncharacterized protein n=1 Tax=Brevundimonas mediterranea TaxID=74329 RepID=A0A7Z9C7L6_9CAUL|nr:hypothetical protein [Brevundimonas mediterranea]MBU4195765.1 hypothetical protein [Alphaproteobacteria bacterium]MBU4238203.1 hypothetical protein [Alphaproteobacteria bacterium]VDC51034.1 hypothetical protein BREV_BREV_02463 [Brevundimonas mediterranea]
MDEDEKEAALARERRRRRRHGFALVVFTLGIVGIGALAASEDSGDAQWAMAVAAAGGVAMLVGAILAWFSKPGQDRRRLDAIMTYRDRVQRNRTIQLFTMSLVVLIEGIMIIGFSDDLLAGRVSEAVVPLLMAVTVSWIIVMTVMEWDGGSRKVKKFLDDELSRHIRARATGLAFIVLMAGATLALAASVWAPNWTPLVLAFSLLASAGAAALRFALLDREASGDGE